MLSLVVDIQSDVVEGSLIKFPQKGIAGLPHIFYSASLHIPRKPHTDGDYLAKMMVRTIEELSLGIVKEQKNLTHERIEEVHFILSSPWVISKAKTIHVTYETEREINEDLIKSVIEADRKDLVDHNEPDMVFVEQKVFDVKLNGYTVEKYGGKKASKLQISFAFTLSSEHVIKKIQAAVKQHLHVKKEHVHSAILLQYLSSRSFSSEAAEYIVLHIHGEHTDVVVVKKSLSAFLTSFPFGTSTITRKISHSTHASFEAASSTLAMYMEAKLSEDEQKKVETILMSVLKGWQTDFTKSVQETGENLVLPRHIHVYSGRPFAPLFKKTLEEIEYEVVIHDEPLREVHSFALKDMI